jgi:hypothetical protein
MLRRVLELVETRHRNILPGQSNVPSAYIDLGSVYGGFFVIALSLQSDKVQVEG